MLRYAEWQRHMSEQHSCRYCCKYMLYLTLPSSLFFLLDFAGVAWSLQLCPGTISITMLLAVYFLYIRY